MASTKFRTSLVTLLVLTLLVIALSLGPQRSASAQSIGTFDTVTSVPFGSECPDGTTSLGSSILPGVTSNGSSFFTACEPDGFVPVSTSAICDESGREWIEHPTLPPVCAGNSYGPVAAFRSCAVGAVRAGAPSVFRIADEAFCVFPIYVAAPPGVPVTVRAPICIESDFAAQHATEASVGTPFAVEGLDYFIHTGPPTCEANCHGGFDFNCDDVLGDYCPVELDLNRVSGTQECITALASASAPTTTGVVPAAPLVTASVPVDHGAGGALAHTGSGSGLLAFVGLGLLGFGATSMGLRRQLHHCQSC